LVETAAGTFTFVRARPQEICASRGGAAATANTSRQHRLLSPGLACFGRRFRKRMAAKAALHFSGRRAGGATLLASAVTGVMPPSPLLALITGFAGSASFAGSVCFTGGRITSLLASRLAAARCETVPAPSAAGVRSPGLQQMMQKTGGVTGARRFGRVLQKSLFSGVRGGWCGFWRTRTPWPKLADEWPRMVKVSAWLCFWSCNLFGALCVLESNGSKASWRARHLSLARSVIEFSQTPQAVRILSIVFFWSLFFSRARNLHCADFRSWFTSVRARS